MASISITKFDINVNLFISLPRLTPLWLISIVLFTGLLPYIIINPHQQDDGGMADTDSCRAYWWTLFGNNFMPMEKQVGVCILIFTFVSSSVLLGRGTYPMISNLALSSPQSFLYWHAGK